mmetsp:Transcript_37286/g.97260  ORF Transcript_37286/g.97260 Transcript_37286/m.97260 type:complete len:416 (+) Transcript_37286:484-1731(+)
MVRGVARAPVHLVRPVVPPHLRAHVGQGGDLWGRLVEDVAAGVAKSAEQVAVHLLRVRLAVDGPDVVEEAPVLGGPEAGLLQPLGGVLAVGHARRLLEHPERPVLQAAARLEQLVVHDHPLAVVGAGGTLRHAANPLRASPRDPVGDHDAHVVWDRGPVIVELVECLVREHRHGRLRHHQARVHNVVVVRAAHHPRVGREAHATTGAAAQGQVIVLEDPVHLAVVRERSVPHEEVAAVRREPDEGRAAPVRRAELQPGLVVQALEELAPPGPRRGGQAPAAACHPAPGPRRELRGSPALHLQQGGVAVRAVLLAVAAGALAVRLPQQHLLEVVGLLQLGRLAVAVENDQVHQRHLHALHLGGVLVVRVHQAPRLQQHQLRVLPEQLRGGARGGGWRRAAGDQASLVTDGRGLGLE